ncbi:universal stress protein [Pinisolibacter sp.]|uniref:universal stress protein n=1 Tax=Pinisolibacter sp. TaxID=2172024 RepID=UPI002FDD96A1
MFTKILVPVDPNEMDFAKSAVAAATNLAMQSGGHVVLVGVLPVMNGYVSEYLPADFEVGFEKETENRIRAIGVAAGLKEGRFSVKLRTGSVYHEVIDEAKESGIDLIVVTSHRPQMSTYLLGSNAAKIVRHATCSVLVLRN